MFKAFVKDIAGTGVGKRKVIELRIEDKQIEIAQNAILMGFANGTISKLTDLTPELTETLRNGK